jgi:hypothetical protein
LRLGDFEPVGSWLENFAPPKMGSRSIFCDIACMPPISEGRGLPTFALRV